MTRAGTTEPRATASDVTLLTTLLGAEHAAIYGYGVLGARLDDGARREAVQVLNRHRSRRDQLTAQLVAGGVVPAESEPAYDIAVADQARALSLAVNLEEGLAVRWRDLVGGTDNRELRRLGVSGLQETALQATRWRLLAGLRPATVALPGAP